MPDGAAFFQKPITNQWIYAELNLPQGEILRKDKFIGRNKDGNDYATGSCDPNLFLNTLTYDVKFSDDENKEHSDNFIAKTMHQKADEGGHNMQILDCIVDYRNDSSLVAKAGIMRLRNKSRQQCLSSTTSGQSLLILWNGVENH